MVTESQFPTYKSHENHQSNKNMYIGVTESTFYRPAFSGAL